MLELNLPMKYVTHSAATIRSMNVFFNRRGGFSARLLTLICGAAVSSFNCNENIIYTMDNKTQVRNVLSENIFI